MKKKKCMCESDNIENVALSKSKELRVLKSAAGFYIGWACDFCGPIDRASHHFATERDADIYLFFREEGPLGGYNE